MRGNVLAGDVGVKLKITILWDVTLYSLVDGHQSLEELPPSSGQEIFSETFTNI
jgi:hypothetical protein